METSIENLVKFGFNDLFNVVAYSVMSIGKYNCKNNLSVIMMEKVAVFCYNIRQYKVPGAWSPS